MNTPDNLQPMIYSANCSKSCKVEFIDGGWKSWKGQAISPAYKKELRIIQEKINKIAKDYIKSRKAQQGSKP